jgi:pimeloyl-ACP methyl ester carboxylesterase
MKQVVLVVLALLAVVLLGAGAWLYTPDRPRALLEARYGAGPGDFRLVAGIRLHLRQSGSKDAPVLLLLHGFGSSLQTWDPWAERLSASWRVIRIDLPGFGLTGPDPTGDYSDRRSVQVLLALLDGLGIAKASLIGNSLGGRIAWKFAASHPDRVDRLVLISPDGFASPGFAYGVAPDIPVVMRLLPYVLPRMMLRASLAPAYGDPARLSDATLDRYYDMMLAPGDRAAIIARMRQTVLADPLPELRRIEAPTLLLWGEKDGMIPLRNATDYLHAMKQARLVVLPGLGHVPFEEAPDEALKPVLAFLASATPDAPADPDPAGPDPVAADPTGANPRP